MVKVMKAAQLTGIKQLQINDVPKPKIDNPTDVLLKIEAVGICGSDVHYYETGRIGDQVVRFPFTIGHECAATVQEVGGEVDNLKPGEMVVVDPAISCYDCDQCRAGRPHTCRNLKFLGCPGQASGCLTEFIVIPRLSCFSTDGNISVEQGVLCEPFSIGIYAVKLSKPIKNKDIAILGAGPIGLSSLISALAEDVKSCYMTEKIPERMEVAKQGGADWVGNPEKEDIVKSILQFQPQGLDVVFECAGQQETIEQAVRLLKPGGKLVMVGIPRKDTIELPVHKMRRNEITVINVRRQNECTQTAVDMIAEGKVNVDFMVTHRFGFEQTKEALDLVSRYGDGVVKAIVNI